MEGELPTNWWYPLSVMPMLLSHDCQIYKVWCYGSIMVRVLHYKPTSQASNLAHICVFRMFTQGIALLVICPYYE